MIDCLDGTKHCNQSGSSGRSLTPSPTTRCGRRCGSRLHASDNGSRAGALRTITKVRHPGLTEADVAVARELVLADATRTPWLPPSVERLARWLWCPSGRQSCATSRSIMGPSVAPAKKLTEASTSRRGELGGDRAPDAARSAAVERSPGSPPSTLGRRPRSDEEDPRGAVFDRLLDDLARARSQHPRGAVATRLDRTTQCGDDRARPRPHRRHRGAERRSQSSRDRHQRPSTRKHAPPGHRRRRRRRGLSQARTSRSCDRARAPRRLRAGSGRTQSRLLCEGRLRSSCSRSRRARTPRRTFGPVERLACHRRRARTQG